MELVELVNKNIECDTEKLQEDLREILDLVSEYKVKVNSFFNKLDFESERKTAWTGTNAINYAKMALQDKNDYLAFGDGIEALIKEAQEFAIDLEGTIKENEDSCENDEDSYSSYYYRW